MFSRNLWIFSRFLQNIVLTRSLEVMKSVKLAGTNSEMPLVGLGTWRASAEDIERAVGAALNCGYRHIDTAFNYGTEEPIGNCLKKWMELKKGTRQDLFITTKLPNFGNRPEDVERFLKLSLKRLQLDYVDLYLVHMPFSFHCNQETLSPAVCEDGSPSQDVQDIVEVWKKMEEQVKSGLAKNIGLSNFNQEQIERIYKNAQIPPAVLQVEMHAYLQQKDLVKLCKNLNIQVTAYSPLGSPGANNHFSSKYNYELADFPDILGHPKVKEIAEKYSKTPGQILLKHLVQQGIVVIPKSGNPDRIKQNIDIFNSELSEEDMATLDGLDRGEKGRIFDFLFFKGIENHPEYPFKRLVTG